MQGLGYYFGRFALVLWGVATCFGVVWTHFYLSGLAVPVVNKKGHLKRRHE